jgi:hypothetical protein
LDGEEYQPLTEQDNANLVGAFIAERMGHVLQNMADLGLQQNPSPERINRYAQLSEHLFPGQVDKLKDKLGLKRPVESEIASLDGEEYQPLTEQDNANLVGAFIAERMGHQFDEPAKGEEADPITAHGDDWSPEATKAWVERANAKEAKEHAERVEQKAPKIASLRTSLPICR